MIQMATGWDQYRDPQKDTARFGAGFQKATYESADALACVLGDDAPLLRRLVTQITDNGPALEQPELDRMVATLTARGYDSELHELVRVLMGISPISRRYSGVMFDASRNAAARWLRTWM